MPSYVKTILYPYTPHMGRTRLTPEQRQEAALRRKEYHRKYRLAYYAKNAARIIARSRAYYAANLKSSKVPRTPEEQRAVNREKERARRADPQYAEKQRIKQREAYASNIEKKREIKRARYKKRLAHYRAQKRAWALAARQTPVGAVRFAIRRHIQRMVECGAKKQRRSCEYLGASFDDVKAYLESRFLPGMSWDNYGPNGWHIDHIKPIASFDLLDPEQVKQAAHYTNLQPLWALDNLCKGAKIA